MKIFIYFVLIATISNGQNIDDWLDPAKEYRAELKMELEAQNVTDYFIINQTEINADFVIPEDNELDCESGFLSKSYIFWNKNNQTWITKFDNCGIFEPIEIYDESILPLFIPNIDKIKVEEVKPYTLSETIIDGDKAITMLEVTHSSQKNIMFYINGEEYKKEFAEYYLTTDEKDVNLNFEYNNKLLHVQLIIACEKIIKQLENEDVLIRITE